MFMVKNCTEKKIGEFGVDRVVAVSLAACSRSVLLSHYKEMMLGEESLGDMFNLQMPETTTWRSIQKPKDDDRKKSKLMKRKREVEEEEEGCKRRCLESSCGGCRYCLMAKS